MSVSRICVAVLLACVLARVQAGAEEALTGDPVQLLARYDANKNGAIPVISEMNWGDPVLLVYEDGRVIFPHADRTKKPADRTTTPSGYLETTLTAEALTALERRVSEVTVFWDLDADYKLTEWGDQPKHTIRLRLPGRPEKTVSVYGEIDPALAPKNELQLETRPPPTPFAEMNALLRDFRPSGAHPWDPGFVEVLLTDYGYAPGPSLPWPENWPKLESPLSRKTGRRGSFSYVMVFPSDRVSELNAFITKRASRGAILIGGAKFSVGSRWPFPGEKNWSTWNF
jgi:hypothetical protein